jgi:catechol 2,3-dioxygenase-like lactoylglutathione lyase family enzyme
MRPQPLIVVPDVEASSRWYQEALGLTSGHGGPAYERLMDGDRLVMQLHHADLEHHHGRIADPSVPMGNGVVLWFAVDDLDAAVERIQALGAPVLVEPTENPGAGHREYWVRDPDGYTLVVAG